MLPLFLLSFRSRLLLVLLRAPLVLLRVVLRAAVPLRVPVALLLRDLLSLFRRLLQFSRLAHVLLIPAKSTKAHTGKQISEQHNGWNIYSIPALMYTARAHMLSPCLFLCLSVYA